MSETAVGTYNAGENNPYAEKRNKQALAASFILATILAPIVMLSALATWATFSYLKIRRSVILMYLGIYLLVAGWTIPVFALNLIIENTTIFVSELLEGNFDWGSFLPLTVGHILVGVPLGIILGLIYASWRWIRRPIWQTFEFKPAPWEIWKGRKTVKEIQNDLNTPFNGLTLGVNDAGERVIQTDAAAAAHTLVVGASGSGKTTTLMSKARDAIKRGQSLIFVDLKGGKDVPQVLHGYAQRYGREFKHWLIQPLDNKYAGPDPKGPACYDPLSRGDATRRKDLLVASRQWSEEFYKIEASNYLQLLFHTIILNPKNEISTLSDVVSMLSPKALLTRAEKLMESNPEYRDILSGIEALNDPRISQAKRNAIEGLRSQLEVILNSAAGRWLLVDPKGNNINLKKASHEGQVIVFSLDSSNYPELAALVANLIIQDLKTLSSELRDDPAPMPTQIFIDEFSAIGSENIIGLINKSRDAGMPVTLSTQALGDLRRVNEAFMDQLLGIINSFIIHRANKDDDAIVYAGLTGLEKKYRFAQTVEMTAQRFGGIGKGAGTGGGRVEEYEDYRVSPNEIQELDMGEMVYLTKAPTAIEKVTVVPEKYVEEMIEDEEETYVAPWQSATQKSENVVNNEDIIKPLQTVEKLEASETKIEDEYNYDIKIEEYTPESNYYEPALPTIPSIYSTETVDDVFDLKRDSKIILPPNKVIPKESYEEKIKPSLPTPTYKPIKEDKAEEKDEFSF